MEQILQKQEINESRLIKRYSELKKELDNQRHSETLRKFKILNEAYNLGKQIYGKNSFSVEKLSLDFELPYTTTKRIMSLSKANRNTWEKIASGKISSFKVAMILMKKNTFYQDEMIDLVIKDNLSTHQIKSLNIKKKEDIDKERLRIAVNNGFSRASMAYSSFKATLDRLDKLLELDKKYLPKSKIPKLKEQIKTIKKKLDKYLKILNE